MKKKKYVKPTSKVVVLSQRPQLLVGSGGLGASRDGYDPTDPQTWP